MENKVRAMKYLALTLVALLLAWSPARATILFAGGEDSDFTCPGTCSVNTSTTSDYTSPYARESYGVTGAAGDPPPNYIQSPTFTAGSTLWIHASVATAAAGGSSTVNNEHMLDVLSPDGVTRISLLQTATSEFYKISKRDSGGTYTDLVTASSACITTAHVVTRIDLFIDYAVTGEVSLFCNGSRIADFLGDVTTNAATQLNQFRLAAAVNNPFRTAWSEIIASTINTTAMRLATLPPQADGTTHTWDVGGVANVNEAVVNDSSVNASGTATQIQLYTMNNIPVTALAISDFIVSGRALVDTTGPQHMQAVVRTGGSNFNSASLAPQTLTFGPNWIDFPLNPNTGLAWTASDLNAAGFNFGYESIN